MDSGPTARGLPPCAPLPAGSALETAAPAGRPLKSLEHGNRLQRAYHRWALPYYEKMQPQVRAQAEALDRFLYSRRGLGFWLGLAGAVLGSSLGLQRAGMPLLLASLLSLMLWAVIPLGLLAAWLQPALFTSAGLRRHFPRVVLLAAVGALLGFATGHVARRGQLDPAVLLERLLSALTVLIPAVLLTALALVALMWGVARVRQQLLEFDLQQARLQQERDSAAREAAEARLKLLRSQIQPHFIFNTLSAVQHWVDAGDPRGAPLLRSLTGFLRRSTDALTQDRVSLADELALVDHYLTIMQARLGERLRIERDITPDLLDLSLPPGLLLTLVENAIEHGISGSLAGGIVQVSARQQAGECQLQVADSAGLLNAGWSEGVGLSNTRERIQRCFGPQARLDLTRGSDGRTLATLRWPQEASRPQARAAMPGDA
jgi:Histidine kinase